MKINLKQALIYLTIAFVVVTIWKSPTATGESVADFLSASADWVGKVAGKFADFWDGMFEDS